MRVYVSIDMEGVAGIATTNQVRRGTDDYPASRLLMTNEANAAVAGAYDAGATEVLVNDAHGDMANLLPGQLDERARLVTGSPKLAGSMMEGLDERFDVALLVGYHAGAGVEAGVLAHTYSSASFYDVRLNGQPVTEAELNAVMAAASGVPIGLVTGDEKICDLAGKRFPGVVTVAVKQGHAATVAASLHPVTACQRIREGAAEAVGRAEELSPYELDPPFELEVELARLTMAELCALTPGAVRVSGRTVRYSSESFPEIFRCLLAWMYLAAAAG